MLKLLHGELYRLIHKKSLYLYFGALAIGYFIVSFVRSGEFDAESILGDAGNFLSMLPAFAGGFLFAAIYTDDLHSKNLTALVGFGIGKAKIVAVKLILMALLGAVIFGAAPLWLFATHAILGWTATASTLGMVYAISLQYWLLTIAFAALAGIAVYGLQRATFALVAYIVLAFNLVDNLVSVALRANFVRENLLSGVAGRILMGVTGGGPLALPMIELAAYVIIAAALSVLAFHKKEMEF
jgi:hypothetical protein